MDSRKGFADVARDATTREKATTRATLENDCHTEGTTYVRARGDLDTGEAGDGMCDVPTAMAMEMAMEMGTAVTPTAADTACTTSPEPMERNENAMRRRRREALASAVGPGDCRSRMV